ncbi:hypothetical protein E4T66_16220 [Sinimarinibacterium sp. CAU 1509]|uniref:hypothetical protein n=1 Tax=Sinimarinibacterium sp. CAU 1509 TaxID=2562283 RepID=UPI0010AC2E89|nr:hypothetical protein [Sinimarinibacterium sp. CAU 1509]TJY58241.1 hypothetical protein E4T66_16220 [Sinimarinibacterium sp. CAU 1509]
MTSSKIDRWLTWLSLLHVTVGLALPLMLMRTAWLDAWLPLGSTDARLALALFGPTVASWGALMFFLVQFGLRQNQRWAADALIIGVLVWAPLDAALCWQHGWIAAVALDAAALLAILVPTVIRRWSMPRL